MPSLAVITRKDLYIAVAALVLTGLLIGGGIMGAAYLYVTKAVAAHEQLKQDTKQQVQETKQSDERAEQGLRETKHTIAQISARVETPKDVIASLPLIHSPFAQYVSEVAGPLPDSPSTLGIANPIYPNPQLVITDPQGFFNAAAECAGSKAELEACTVKLANANKRTELETKRADDAEKIMKGGGFFSRLKSNSKWFVIGGGITVGILCGTGHCK